MPTATAAAPITHRPGCLPPALLPSVLAFSFPLNAYAALLQWEEGEIQGLHYGLFAQASDPIAQAQLRATEALWTQMPPACRLLEVGVGLGHTLKALVERGYDALGITPEPAQAEVVRRWHGASLPLAVTRLEDLQLPAGSAPFRAMVLQESAQYIAPLALFEAAQRLLDPEDATLLVMDEFALQRRSDEDIGLHLLPHVKALAARCGWQLEHEADVTPQAAHTITVLQRLTARHRERLQAELGLDAPTLQDLDQALQRYARCYASGVYGYRVLRWTRRATAGLHPVALTPARAGAMRGLFERVFGRPMGEAEWHWKYGDGRGHGVGLVDGQAQMQVFYGGLTRPLRLLGRPALGCQVCDVMTAPGSHASLGRQGPMHQAAASFLEQQIGWARPHAVGFGFPTDRALGMAERRGLYERVDEMVQVRWPALGPPDGTWREQTPGGAGVAVETIGPHTWAASPAGPWGPVAASAWEAMAAALQTSVLGVRDCAWLHYRYGLKPGVQHHLLHLPGAGLAIFRLHESHLEWLDVVAPPSRFADLALALRGWLALAGPKELRLWVTRSHAALFRRAGDEAVQDDLNLHVPANRWTAGVPPAMLAQRWFLTGGDTDFR